MFTSKQSIDVSISLSEYKAERAYISVYSNYQLLASGRYYPDASSRTIAGTLQQGEFENSFLALNKQAKFLIEESLSIKLQDSSYIDIRLNID